MDEMQHECNTKKAKPATSAGFRGAKVIPLGLEPRTLPIKSGCATFLSDFL
jgi:hypothetical protein